LVWTTTKDEGQKAIVGKKTEDYAVVTVSLPFLTAEDIAVKLQWCDKQACPGQGGQSPCAAQRDQATGAHRQGGGRSRRVADHR
jgi:hypothetical protein